MQTPKETVQKGIDPAEIAGVGIDGQSVGHRLTRGQSTTTTLIWMDTRAQEICERLNKKIGEDKTFEVAGNSLQPSYTTADHLVPKKIFRRFMKRSTRSSSPTVLSPLS